MTAQRHTNFPTVSVQCNSISNNALTSLQYQAHFNCPLYLIQSLNKENILCQDTYTLISCAKPNTLLPPVITGCQAFTFVFLTFGPKPQGHRKCKSNSKLEISIRMFRLKKMTDQKLVVQQQ